jgi:hypothetical protein
LIYSDLASVHTAESNYSAAWAGIKSNAEVKDFQAFGRVVMLFFVAVFDKVFCRIRQVRIADNNIGSNALVIDLIMIIGRVPVRLIKYNASDCFVFAVLVHFLASHF